MAYRWDPWRGCHTCSEGCLHCYIYKGDTRRGIDTSLIAKTDSFRKPIEKKKDGSFQMGSGLVYTCFSSDFFLEEADEWRKEVWAMIKERSDCMFLFLTKRIERFTNCIPEGWGEGYENVHICCTVENQKDVGKKLPLFSQYPIRHKSILLQPLLEEVDISPYLENIEEVVVGGESDQNARPLDFDWVLAIRKQCMEKNVKFTFRQCGSHFIKDGRTYHLPVRLLKNQAKKAGIDWSPAKEEPSLDPLYSFHTKEAKSILSSSNGMNLYRGCTHGCIYCDTRSTCYQFDHPFEDIEIKVNAPELLEKALSSKRKPCMIGTGSMCDPYLHFETKTKLTRTCLEIIGKYDCGVAIQTKSNRILRDLDLLDRINTKAKTVVSTTFTTYDENLCRILEPNVSTTKERYEFLKVFQAHDIPTIVWLSPILPFLNDTEENLRGLLDYAFDAGVKGIICFGMGLTLREGNREYFYASLDKHFPGLKERYMKTYGNSYEVTSPINNRLMRVFTEECERHGVLHTPEACFSYMREFPEKPVNLPLFPELSLC